MKTVSLLTICTTLLTPLLANAASVIVGDDADQMPAAAAALDGAIPMIIVDYQANLYTNTSGSAQILDLSIFSFYAADPGTANNTGTGHVRPFVGLLTGGGLASADYDVLAIGDNRIEGIDFTDGGLVSLPFGGASPSITVPAGGILVGGIEQGTNGAGSNVVPFASGTGFNTFITGGGPAGTLDIVTDITDGGSTWSALNGGRNYEFTITLVPEPSVLTLLPIAIGLMLLGRRRRSQT